MTVCNCGCSTLGPDHDPEARHPNPKACIHAVPRPREAAESYRAAIRRHDEDAMWFWAGEMAAAALDTEPEPYAVWKDGDDTFIQVHE